jgi:hypothetical protein
LRGDSFCNHEPSKKYAIHSVHSPNGKTPHFKPQSLFVRASSLHSRRGARNHRQKRGAGGLCGRRIIFHRLCHAGSSGHSRRRGTLAFGYVFPISIVIVALLAIVVLSYEQIIHAYPGGGGAYIVASDNLGKIPALVAAAALLTDYILTVSVSISSGVAQIVSAYPQWYEYRVAIAVFFVALIMVINLRGVRESGAAFAIPSYFFIAMMLFMIGTGLFRIDRFAGNGG